MPAATQSRHSAPIAALVLDMDGLLVDSETVSGEALRLFLADHGHEMLPSTLEDALGRRLPEAMEVVAAAYELPGPLEELVVAFDAMRLEALRGNVVAMVGAVELLDWAAARGLPRALATSSSRGQAEVALTEAALIGRFDVEDARGGRVVDVLTAGERLDQAWVVSEVGDTAQLDLVVVGDEQLEARRGHERLAEAAAELGAHGDVVQVRRVG